MVEVLYNKAHLVVLTGAVVLAAVSMYLSSNNETQAEESIEQEQGSYTPEKAYTFGIPVAGTVDASESIVVRAQTAGIVQKLFAEEGDMVGAGHALLVQEVPLVSSRIALQNAQNGLSALSEDASYIAQNGTEEATQLKSAGASSTALLTRQSGRTATEDQAALLEASLYSSVTDLVSTLDFVDENQQYFNANSLSEFRDTVGGLYGKLQPYLTGSIQYKLESRDDLLQLLEDVTENKTHLDPDTLIPLAERIDEELSAARKILTEGETEFLDARVVSADDGLYSGYFDQRNSIVNAQTKLRTFIASARGTEMNASLSTLSAETEREVWNAQALTTALLTENARKTVVQTKAVSEATLQVLRGEEALGRPTAPFQGTVGDVYVREGEFVMTGTPLMTFIGAGARELKVTVPHSMLQYVTVGAPFIVDSVTVGHVEHLTPTLSNGSATVVIGLDGGEYAVGDVLRGSIEGRISEGESIAIPRSYVHFDNGGGYIRTESGRDIRGEIIHDTGDLYVMKLEDTLTERVMEAVGIEL